MKCLEAESVLQGQVSRWAIHAPQRLWGQMPWEVQCAFSALSRAGLGLSLEDAGAHRPTLFCPSELGGASGGVGAGVRAPSEKPDTRE